MIKINFPTAASQAKLIKRPSASFGVFSDEVKQIFNAVRLQGDVAIKKYTVLFDKVNIVNVQVTEAEIFDAIDLVSNELKAAIQLAKSNIDQFHAAQKTIKVAVETMEGVFCWQEKRPIQSVGLYIPGGTAPLFSTVLMLAIPAKLAGCSEIILCTPPDSSGNVAPAILYAAALCGVKTIFKVGGIQAIAAMTFGTKKIPKVLKIFGPGNQYVTHAKQWATQYGVAIDMPAGPSELLVVADDSAVPAFVASDLLSQAEHGVDSQVILVSNSIPLLEAVAREMRLQLKVLPRKKIAEKAIQKSKLIYLKNDSDALDFINQYAPEHLIICSKQDHFYIDNIQNAGSVFIGNYTPESAGDYASGTNHTLPTNGYAKNYSGVNLDSFLKTMTFQKITSKGIQNIGKAIEIMAEAEGLQGHKNAVSLRLAALDEMPSSPVTTLKNAV